MRVASVSIYPVKSTAPTDLASAEVQLAGLRNDRRWMVVDAVGRKVTAFRHDALLGVTATAREDGSLRVGAAGHPDLEIDVPIDGRPVPTRVTRLATARDAGEAAAGWFSDIVGKPVRLVWQDDPAKRTVTEKHGGAGEPLSLADTAPLLLTTTASLSQLNEWIATEHEPDAMEMRRFRPNVVVEGDIAPFAEDGWKRVRIGDVVYRFAEHCDRCVVTTIDPVTLKHGREPIRSLARHRKWDGKTWFGIRIIPLDTGRVSVGDEVSAG